jgi:hypothetical protein
VKLESDITEYSLGDTQGASNNKKKGSSHSTDFCSPGLEIISSTSNSSNIEEFIEFSPRGLQHLKQNKEMEVTIKFKGVRRIKSLKAKLGLKIDSFVLPLTIIKGNCIIASFYLNRTYISFGTIFEGCIAEEKVVLVNNGDLGSK